MATNGLDEVTFDGTSARIWLGTKIFPFISFGVPAQEVKTEKIRPIGKMIATRRTPGVQDVADISAEILVTDWIALLGFLPANGWTFAKFPVTINHKHPAVSETYGIICDNCRFTKIEQEVKNDEKGAMKKLGISVMNVLERGTDRKWKSMAFNPALPSPSAQALINAF